MSDVPIIDQEDEFTLEIWVGKTFEKVIELKEDDGETVIPLTGFTARGQIREFPDGPLCADFACTVDADDGAVTIALTAADTRKITKDAVYDVEGVSGDTVIGLLGGPVELRPGVTKA